MADSSGLEGDSTVSTLHPLFRSILALHGMPEACDEFPIRRAAYVSALLRMDWLFEFSDDHLRWRAAREELHRLRAERKVVDPDGLLWRANAHPNFIN
jgi:hypothetical protein